MDTIADVVLHAIDSHTESLPEIGRQRRHGAVDAYVKAREEALLVLVVATQRDRDALSCALLGLPDDLLDRALGLAGFAQQVERLIAKNLPDLSAPNRGELVSNARMLRLHRMGWRPSRANIHDHHLCNLATQCADPAFFEAWCRHHPYGNPVLVQLGKASLLHLPNPIPQHLLEPWRDALLILSSGACPDALKNVEEAYPVQLGNRAWKMAVLLGSHGCRPRQLWKFLTPQAQKLAAPPSSAHARMERMQEIPKILATPAHRTILGLTAAKALRSPHP